MAIARLRLYVRFDGDRRPATGHRPPATGARLPSTVRRPPCVGRPSTATERMHRPITGYHLDDESQWVADLACGHTQHVRHDPPWQVREWVTTEAGRRSRIGMMLDCRLCDAPGRVHDPPGRTPA
jgi:hypothetical protein